MSIASAVGGALAGVAALLTAVDAVPKTVGDAAATKGAEGARYYEEGRYLPALNAYRDAQLEDPESPLLQFNIGDALYKTGDLDGALSQFQEVSAKGSDALKAGSLYNMGNVYFQQGQYPQAVWAFRQALEYDWEDDGARANLELALQRLQQQQQLQQSQQGEESDEEEGDQEGESAPSGEEKREDPGPREGEQQEQEQQQSEAARDSSEQGADPEPETPGDEAEGESMAQREAEQLLDAFEDRELAAQRLRYRGRRQNQQKDW